MMTEPRSPIYRPSAGAGPSGEGGNPQVKPEVKAHTSADTHPKLPVDSHEHGKDCNKHVIDVPPGGVDKGVCKGKCRGKDKEKCKGGCKGKGNILQRLLQETTYSQMMETETDTDSTNRRSRHRRRRPRAKKGEKKITPQGSRAGSKKDNSVDGATSTSGGDISPVTGRSGRHMVKGIADAHESSPTSCPDTPKPGSGHSTDTQQIQPDSPRAMATCSSNSRPSMSPTNPFHDMNDKPLPDTVINPFQTSASAVRDVETGSRKEGNTSKTPSDLPSYITVHSAQPKKKKRQAPGPPKYHIASVEMPETRSQTKKSSPVCDNTTVQMPSLSEEEVPITPPPTADSVCISPPATPGNGSGSPPFMTYSPQAELKEASNSSTETLHPQSPPWSAESSPSKDGLLMNFHDTEYD
jgi:hypothetical protein